MAFSEILSQIALPEVIEARIEFKILVLAYNVYHGIGPKYLT